MVQAVSAAGSTECGSSPGANGVEPEAFTLFTVVVVSSSHSRLTVLAGRADDPDWQQKLAGMVSYAGSKGWLDEQGRIRAHVETQDG